MGFDPVSYLLGTKNGGISSGSIKGVQVDGVDLPIDANKKVNLVCNTMYDADTNKLATMEDVSHSGSGGLLPQLTVTGPTAGSTVTAIKGAKRVTLTESSGVWTGDLTDYGTWTVAASHDSGGAASDAILVDAVKQYSMTLLYFDATINITAPDGSVVSVKKDGVTINTHNGTGEAVSVSVHEAGIYNIEAVNGTDTVSDSVTITTAGEIVDVRLVARIYGVSWDGTSSSSCARTDDAAMFVDPVPYVAGAEEGSYGSPFDDLMPWAGMVRITDSAAGELVRIPKFWYKLEQNGTNGVKIQIADGPVAGFSVSPAHMDRGDGKGERSYVYIGRYHNADDYTSKTGVMPYQSTREDARNAIHALGNDIWQQDYTMRFTICLLYIVEFANWNCQAKIGYGCGDDNDTGNMGYTDNMPYHTGTTYSSRTTYGLGTQYRYIEGLWDNVYDYLDGCYFQNKSLSLILNPANFSESGGIGVGEPERGWISGFSVNHVEGLYPIFISSEARGSSSTYVPDMLQYTASFPSVYSGGEVSQSMDSGLFHLKTCVGYQTLAGSRLMKLP